MFLSVFIVCGLLLLGLGRSNKVTAGSYLFQLTKWFPNLKKTLFTCQSNFRAGTQDTSILAASDPDSLSQTQVLPLVAFDLQDFLQVLRLIAAQLEADLGVQQLW